MKSALTTTPKAVAVFNLHKRYVGVVNSITATAQILGVSAASVFDAMTGNNVTCRGHYLREYCDELFKLDTPPNLIEYDAALGVERKYYPTAKVTRTGMKYKRTKLRRFKTI